MMSKPQPDEDVTVIVSDDEDKGSSSSDDVQITGVVSGRRNTGPCRVKQLVTYVKREGGRYYALGEGFLLTPPRARNKQPAQNKDKEPEPVITLGTSSSEGEAAATNAKTVQKNSQQSKQSASSQPGEQNNNQQKNGTDDEFESPHFSPAIDRCMVNLSNSRRRGTKTGSSSSGSSCAERIVDSQAKKRNRTQKAFDSASDACLEASTSKRQKISNTNSNADDPNMSGSSLGRSPSSAKKRIIRKRFEERRKRAYPDSSDDEDVSRYAKVKRTMKIEFSPLTTGSKPDHNLSSASTQPPSGYEKNPSSASTQPPENNESRSASDSDVLPSFDIDAAAPKIAMNSVMPKSMTVLPPEKLIEQDQQKISSVRAKLNYLKNKKNSLLQNCSITSNAAVPDKGNAVDSVAGKETKDTNSSDPDLDLPLDELRKRNVPSSERVGVEVSSTTKPASSSTGELKKSTNGSGLEFNTKHFGKFRKILQKVQKGIGNSGSSAHEEEDVLIKTKAGPSLQGVRALSDSTYDSPLAKTVSGVNALSDSLGDEEVERLLDEVEPDAQASSLGEEDLLREMSTGSKTGPDAGESNEDWSADLEMALGLLNPPHEAANEKEKETRLEKPSSTGADDSQVVRESLFAMGSDESFSQSQSILHSTPVVHARRTTPGTRDGLSSEEVGNAGGTQAVPISDVKVEKLSQADSKIDIKLPFILKEECGDLGFVPVIVKTEPGLLFAVKKEEPESVGECWTYSQEDGVITIYDSEDDFMREMSQRSMMLDSSDSDVLCDDPIEEIEMTEISKQSLAEVWAQLEAILPPDAGPMEIKGFRDEDINDTTRKAWIDDDDDDDEDEDDVTDDKCSDAVVADDNERESDYGSDGFGVEEERQHEGEDGFGMEFMSQGFNVNQSFREYEDEEEEIEEDEDIVFGIPNETRPADEEENKSSTTGLVQEKGKFFSDSESALSDDSLTMTELQEAIKKAQDRLPSRGSDSECSSISKSSVSRGPSPDDLPTFVHKSRNDRKPMTIMDSSSDSDYVQAGPSSDLIGVDLGEPKESESASKVSAEKETNDSVHPSEHSSKHNKSVKHRSREESSEGEKESVAKKKHSLHDSGKKDKPGKKSKSDREHVSKKHVDAAESDNVSHVKKSGQEQKQRSKSKSSSKIDKPKETAGSLKKQKHKERTSSKAAESRSRHSSAESVRSTTSKSSEETVRAGGLSSRRSSSGSNVSGSSRRLSSDSAHSLVIDEGFDIAGDQMHLSDQDDVVETTPKRPVTKPFHTASPEKLEAVKQKVLSNFNPKKTQLTTAQKDKKLEQRRKRQEEERAKDERRKERREKKEQKEKEKEAKAKKKSEGKQKEKSALSDSCDSEFPVEGFYRPGAGRQNKPATITSPEEEHADSEWLSSRRKPVKRHGSLAEQAKKQLMGCKQANADRMMKSKELKERQRQRPKATHPLARQFSAAAPSTSLGSYRIPRSRHSSGETTADATTKPVETAKPSDKPLLKRKPPPQRGFSSRQARLTESMLQTQRPAARSDKVKSQKAGAGHDKVLAASRVDRQNSGAKVGDATSVRRPSVDNDNSTKNKRTGSRSSSTESKGKSFEEVLNDLDKNAPVAKKKHSSHAASSRTENRHSSKGSDGASKGKRKDKKGSQGGAGPAHSNQGRGPESSFRPIREGGESPMDVDALQKINARHAGSSENPIDAEEDTRRVVLNEIQTNVGDDVRHVIRPVPCFKENGEKVVGILKEPGIKKPKGRIRWHSGVRSPEPRPIRPIQYPAQLPDSQEIIEPHEVPDDGYNPLPIPRKNQTTTLAALMDDFIYYVISWNFNWLKEQERMTQLPPIIHPQKIHPNVRTFDSILDYYKIFTPFIILETWQKITHDYRHFQGDNAFHQQTFLSSHVALPGSGNIRPFDLNCKVLRKKQPGLLFKEDDLVMLLLTLAEENRLTPTMAYVKKVTVASVSPAVLQDRSLASVINGKDQRDLLNNFELVTYKFTIKFKKIVYNPGTVIMVHALSSLTTVLRQFSAMFYLSKNQYIRDHILKPNRPNVFNEGTAVMDRKVLQYGYRKDQADAICMAAKAALQPYTSSKIILIKGPAGSGKTHMIPEMLRQMMRMKESWIPANQRPKILVCAPNDCALDTLVKMILRKRNDPTCRFNVVRIGSKNIHPDVAPFTLNNLIKMQAERLTKNERTSHLNDIKQDLLKLEASIIANIQKIDDLKIVGGRENLNEARILQDNVDHERSRKEKQQKIYDQLQNHAIEAMTRQRFKDAEIRKDLLDDADVVCCVLNSPEASDLMDYYKTCLKGQTPANKVIKFTCAIIDEAVSCSELDTLIPLQFGITKLIMLGDTEQLQANVLTEKSYELKLGCSMFKRLIEYWHFKVEGMYRPVLEVKVQHRAGQEIARFPWSFFYNKDDPNAPCPYTRRAKELDSMSRIVPYMVFDLKNEKLTPEESKSEPKETLELKFLQELCETVRRLHPDHKIVIISPTNDVKFALRAKFRNSTMRNVDVLGVESVQGKEHPVIIIPCFCMGNNMDPVGELAEEHKCLVALTRAQRALYICGRMHLVRRKSKIWEKLVNDAGNRRCLLNVQNRMDARKIERPR